MHIHTNIRLHQKRPYFLFFKSEWAQHWKYKDTLALMSKREERRGKNSHNWKTSFIISKVMRTFRIMSQN